jgi:glycosyltransferase involved in cell wall biosynthesis
MRIAIDGRTIVHGRSGVGTYAHRIVSGLLRRDQRNEYFLFLSAPWPDLEAPNLRKFVIERSDRMIRNRWWENVRLPRYLVRHQVDVYFSPAYALPVRPRFTRRGSTRFVVTIHDVITDILPETFTLRMRVWQALFNRNAVALADRIIVDSESTKRDLLRLYGPTPQPVCVVPLSVGDEYVREVDPVTLQRVRERYALPQSFVLFVGTIEPRKNVAGLARAYQRLPEELRRRFPLVICGAIGWHAEPILSELNALNVSESIRCVGFAAHEDLPALYSLASLFVYPSFYEGFGYPPLEAMACGVPVITSNTSSLPEVVGDAGIMVDPRDEAALAASIQRVLEDRELQARLSLKGLEQAARFRWQTTADETLAILESAGREDSAAVR